MVIEEFTFAAPNTSRVADGQASMVLGTLGHASGWMNWYIQFPHEPDFGRHPGSRSQRNSGRRLAAEAPWGLRARDLIAQLHRSILSRLSPKTTIKLDRQKELVPHTLGTQLRIVSDWGAYQHPIDFLWPSNKWIDLQLQPSPGK